MSITKHVDTLRTYQQAADAWLEAHPRSILADDKGLGKTRSSIATLSRHLPALVVAPTYLCMQWYEVLCQVLPDASICLPEGAHARKKHELQQPRDVRIIGIPMLRTHRDYLPQDINTLLVDEAHHLRVSTSTHSEVGRELAWRVPRVHMLTGTPYYKEDSDIWHLLHILDPKRFSSYWNFIREWFTVNWHAPYAPKIYGVSRKKRAEFDAMMSEYMLLRDYKDVGRELPPLVEEVITFDLPAPLRKEYTALKKKWQLLGEPVEAVGSVYYLLRQLTMCHTKLDAVHSIIDSIPRTEGVLVYCWYKESAHTLAARLKRGYKEEVDTLLLTGDTPPNKRAALLADQKRRKWPRVVIATIEALQEGVNMEHIRHVIYAEETYVRGKHDQTLARARRDRGDAAQHTQQPPVISYYVRARKTVDERIPVIRNSRGTAGDRELARDLAREVD
jgi:superfamily II DNA or RNA helicase